MNKICDECETVAHCTKHGCIPKVSAKDSAMRLALEALEIGKRYARTLMMNQEPFDAAINALAEQPAPSQYGSPELQDMVLARAVKKINANSQPAQQQEPVVCTKCGASLGTLHLATGDKNCPFGQRVRHSDCTPQPAQQEPEIVQRVKRYAGQTPRTARNPNITARECIELANWIAATPHPAKQEPAAWMHEWEDGEKIPMLKGRDDRNQDKPKTVRPLVYGDTSPQPAQQEPLGFMNAGSILEMQQKSLPYGYVYPEKSTGVSVAVYTSPPAERRPLTAREIELINGMIEVQLDHAARCDNIANRVMAEKQKGWDMERVELLRKFKENT